MVCPIGWGMFEATGYYWSENKRVKCVAFECRCCGRHWIPEPEVTRDEYLALAGAEVSK